MPPRLRSVLAGALLLGIVLAACGGSASVSADCGDVVEEELDPTWTVHLLPNADLPDYLTAPPTSGPHVAAEPVTGILENPLDEPLQVTVLEVGGVLLQYRPADVMEADLGRLRRLASDDVVVAPNADLDAPVVATAWTTKQSCEGVAIDALDAFIGDHSGQGPAAG